MSRQRVAAHVRAQPVSAYAGWAVAARCERCPWTGARPPVVPLVREPGPSALEHARRRVRRMRREMEQEAWLVPPEDRWD